MTRTTSTLRKKLSWLLIIITILFAGLCVNVIWFKPFNINLLFDRTLIELALNDPQGMSRLGILDSTGLDYYNKDLSDPSINQQLKMYQIIEKELSVMKSYDRSKLSKEDLLSLDIAEWYLENALGGKDYVYDSFPVNQYLGVQKSLPEFMTNIHAINNKRDAENYIIRLSKFNNYFEQVIQTIKDDESHGVMPPNYIISSTLSDMKNFVQQDPASNVLYTSFKQKVDSLNISQKEKEQLLQNALEQIKVSVYPGYSKLISYYEEMLPKSKDYVGVWNLPNGDTYYAYQIKNNTTLDITPEEVYNISTEEVKKLNEQIKALEKKGEGKAVNDQSIKTLEDCQAIIDQINQNLPKIFGIVPKSKVEVEFAPDTGGGSYGLYQYNPSDMSGSRQATIYIPKEDLPSNAYGMKWILYHEGIPGHHLQFSIAREQKSIPWFRKAVTFTPYTEGWATYAQYLPWEYNLTSDEGSEIQILKTKLYHIGRMAIDVGVNYKHWTREEAAQYAVDNNIGSWETGVEIAEFSTAYPGMQCAYGIGDLKIVELRNLAQSKLGNKFDIKAFHDTILKNGQMPLELLEKQVEELIKEERL